MSLFWITCGRVRRQARYQGNLHRTLSQIYATANQSISTRSFVKRYQSIITRSIEKKKSSKMTEIFCERWKNESLSKKGAKQAHLKRFIKRRRAHFFVGGRKIENILNIFAKAILQIYYTENLLGAADSLLQALKVLNLPEEGYPLLHFRRSILKFRHRLNGKNKYQNLFASALRIRINNAGSGSLVPSNAGFQCRSGCSGPVGSDTLN